MQASRARGRWPAAALKFGAQGAESKASRPVRRQRHAPLFLTEILDMHRITVAAPLAIALAFAASAHAGANATKEERVELAQSKGTFWHYKFTNPVSKKIEPKQMYCEKLDDVAVCGGIYK
ncbi:MAG TPA: hypothetical protein VLJ62_32280 [Burkholderiaceae bacterium]|nr:hypothetical protein [Burkholderiaceae bacterium]